MKINERQALLTNTLYLVPYSAHHVHTYHEWMQDEDLQKATASEPLTLEEEYAMQRSWRSDADKLTFIVCNAPPSSDSIEPGERVAEQMIGDVNLFIYADDEEEEEKDVQDVVGEIEIMIASKDSQGKGLGRQILLAFMWYILNTIGDIMREYHASNSGSKERIELKYLRVKIGAENARSIRLFESVGFKKIKEEPNYFGELELRWPVSGKSRREVEEAMGDANVPVMQGY